MSATALIKRADVQRLLAGAKDAGYARVRLSIDPTGTIVLDAGDDLPAISEDRPRNPLDRLLEPR